MRSRIDIHFGEEAWVADAAGILFHPRASCLIVSDLHLEKSSYLARYGALLPRYDSQDTLQRLQRLIMQYQPNQVICLGDSFHDTGSYQRLTTSNQALLCEMIRSTSWQWILGNHDPYLPQHLPGNYTTERIIGNVRLRHEPAASELPQIVGHFHPKAAYKAAGSIVKGKAFIHDSQLLIMPAFGTYTGGLEITHQTIQSLFQSAHVYLCYREALFKVPYNSAV
jgi:hypothetical protein